MKSNRKKINVLIILGIFFAITAVSSFNYTIEIRDETNLKSPKSSGYWTTNFIHIDGNWSDTATTYAWCSGDGSWGNPYTIEDVIIDASTSPTGSGIFINNSKNEYFIITNCTAYNAGTGSSDAGIKLENTNNGTLTNNNCSNNNGMGISLHSNCENNTLSGNTANNNANHGIRLYISCIYNSILENTINDNTEAGIRFRYGCDNNIISGNTVNDNLYGMSIYDNSDNNTISGNIVDSESNGIIFFTNCDKNTISGNTVNNNANGIYLANQCGGNTISGNTANNNGCGIFLQDNTHNNIVSGNTANNNIIHGIYVWYYCDDNTISGNSVDSNHGNGIYLENNCVNNTISGNVVDNNLDNGIDLVNSCVNNTISGNAVTNSNDHGILFYTNCNNNTISGNTVTNSRVHGIRLRDNCNYNIISGNTANDNGEDGILLRDICHENTVSGNILYNNGEAGLRLRENCDKNIIIGNAIYYNNQYGVLSGSTHDGNLFYLNSFIGNVYHVRDEGNNQWDNGIFGNYWDNYSGYDLLPMDGIGDTPHSFPVDKYDTKPLMYLGWDTDGDTFSDSDEASYGTNALDASWYPMPNLKVSHLSSVIAYNKTSFIIDFSITNNGIWKAHGVIIIVRCEELDLTLYDNTFSTLTLDVDETEYIAVSCPPIGQTGTFTLSLTVDPYNSIDETYSSKDGSLRPNSENDNSMQADLTVITMDVSRNGGNGDNTMVIITGTSIAAGIGVAGVIIGLLLRRKRISGST